jgi:hypothetical protein
MKGEWHRLSSVLRNEMSNLYRGPSIDASYQFSYHLAKQFQTKTCFRNRTIRNKNCLWWPCLLTDQNGMSNPLTNIAATGNSCFRLVAF